MVLDMVMPAKASYLKLLPPQKRLASSCRSVRVEAEAEIERIHRELLDPFAIARWGQSAATVSASLVLHLARVGRLDCLQPRDLQIAARAKGHLIAVRMLCPLSLAKSLERLWFPWPHSNAK